MRDSEKSLDVSTSDDIRRFPDECFTIMLKYLTLTDIMLKIMPLSKSVREQVITENYILFKHFLRYFNLN